VNKMTNTQTLKSLSPQPLPGVMNKANILEIFQSIQGEGKYAGVKQVFVRFFECNMYCSWCDTPHSIGDAAKQHLKGASQRYKEYTLEDLLQRIDALWKNCHSVSLTGGEPLVQKSFIKELLPRLKDARRRSYLETNGVLPEALEVVIDHIDIIAMDIKLPSSTKCRPYWKEHEEFLKIALKKDIFIKTVISKETDKEDIVRAAGLVARVDPDILFIIQPNTYDLPAVMGKCIEFQEESLKQLNNVRILPQVHKFMKLR